MLFGIYIWKTLTAGYLGKRQAGDKARKRCRNRKVSEEVGDIMHREEWPLDGINHTANCSACTDPVLILLR